MVREGFTGERNLMTGVETSQFGEEWWESRERPTESTGMVAHVLCPGSDETVTSHHGHPVLVLLLHLPLQSCPLL